MKSIPYLFKTAGIIFLAGVFIYSCNTKTIRINDEAGILSDINVPIRIEVELNKNQVIAAEEGRLAVLTSSDQLIPFQLDRKENANSVVGLIMSDKISGIQSYKLVKNKTPQDGGLNVTLDPNTRQVIIKENDKLVLQYNYQTVYEKDVIRPESKKNTGLIFSAVGGEYYDEYLKAHPELQKNDTTTSRIYSVPRSDYIHPLYGLEGEMLTSDWPDGGHPHHRGIFWAWPEVEYRLQRGDIYALQRVFARPTGNIEFTGGPVFGQIDAENLWMWEDSIPVVNEHAVIRVYRSSPETRIIDLTLKFLALKDSVTIATRFTNSYGGLNIRMQTPEKQDISYFTDEKDANPLRAWSDFNGIFEGNNSVSGMMVLQHKDNPEYPGEWRDYPDLAWVQPTFPIPDTRLLLSKEVPLILRYRLIIHSGEKPSDEFAKMSWDAYNTR
jgi:hypothetical protein